MKKSSPSLWKLYRTFAVIGACMFGGGYAMLPLLQRYVVEQNNWATEEEMADYYAVGQCTPGIIAVNSATFVGYRQRGVMGSVITTLGIITVPMAIICVIAAVLGNFANIPAVQHAFAGIRCAAAALIIAAVIRLIRTNVKNWWAIVLCVLAFLAVALLGASPVIVVVCAAAVGILAGQWGKGRKDT